MQLIKSCEEMRKGKLNSGTIYHCVDYDNNMKYVMYFLREN